MSKKLDYKKLFYNNSKTLYEVAPKEWLVLDDGFDMVGVVIVPSEYWSISEYKQATKSVLIGASISTVRRLTNVYKKYLKKAKK